MSETNIDLSPDITQKIFDFGKYSGKTIHEVYHGQIKSKFSGKKYLYWVLDQKSNNTTFMEMAEAIKVYLEFHEGKPEVVEPETKILDKSISAKQTKSYNLLANAMVDANAGDLLMLTKEACHHMREHYLAFCLVLDNKTSKIWGDKDDDSIIEVIKLINSNDWNIVRFL